MVRDRWETERKVTKLRVGVRSQRIRVVQIVLLHANTQQRDG